MKSALPGIVSSEPSFFFANPELRVTLDRARAAELGVRASDVASAVRLMMSGEDEISNFREAGEQYPVKLCSTKNSAATARFFRV